MISNTRSLRAALAVLCLCGVCVTAAGQDKPKAPSMKKVERPVVPPTHLRKYYDRAHDATYINVDISLLPPNAKETVSKESTSKKSVSKESAPTPARELKLTFQLIYKGATTADLQTAYLFIESDAPATDASRLDACKQIALKADAYEYAYARTDYQTETLALEGVAQSTPPWQKEIVAFALPLDDLPQLVNPTRLVLKLCTETFNINSLQLTDLRHTLSSGTE